MLVALAWAGVASALPPPACDPAVVINDSHTDGHHGPTDVLSAWLSEEDGGDLQAVIKVDLGNWDAEHDEDEIVAGYVFLFTVNGATRFVRLSVDVDFQATYDYGTYTFPNTFTSQGMTTGRREPEPTLPPWSGDGTAVIDIPTIVADDGDLLTDTFVLTYDGIVGGPPNPPTWVDAAPGGELAGRGRVRALLPRRRVRRRPAQRAADGYRRAEGDDLGHGDPCRGRRRRRDHARDAERDLQHYDRSRRHLLDPNVRAREDDGRRGRRRSSQSQTRTIRVRSEVTIKAKELANGKTKITGKTNPALPGRIQLFKTTAFFPTTTKQIGGGTFQLPAKNLKPGRYQVLYTPRGGRALRDFSNKVTVG